MMKLTEEIIKYRAKHNLSQRAFAEKCGVTLQTINSVESESQTPSKLTEAKIRLVLDADTEGKEE